MIKRRLFAALVLVLVLGCAHGSPSIWSVAPAEQIHPAAGARSELADGLLRRVVRGEGHPRALYQEVTSALAGAPGDHRLHEAAGYLAELLGDERAMWSHFLRAAADTSAPPEQRAFYLEEATRPAHTVAEDKAAIALLEAIAREAPSAARDRALDLVADLYLRHGRKADADRAVAGLGFVGPLFVAGSFDNDQGKGFFTRFPPEDGVDLAAEMEGLLLPVRWREVALLDAKGRARLDAAVSPSREAVAYLAAFVDVDADVDVEVRLTTTDAARVFVNQALVGQEERVARARLDNLVAPARLAKGRNVVLIKSAQRAGTWTVGLRITAPGGAPLDGVRIAREPGGDLNVAKALPPGPASLPEWLDVIEDGPRKAFLASRFATLRGDARGSLAPLLPLVEAFPKSALAMLHTASAMRANDEDGRALDLLTRAAAEGLAGVLDARAAMYVDKRRYDKAQADLEAALEDNPDARRSRLRLAQVYERRGFQVERCRILSETRARWPDLGWAVRDLARCLESRGYDDDAERALLDANRLEPGHRYGLDQLARFAARRGEHDSALRRLEALIALDASDLSVRIRRADRLRLMGERKRARAAYEELRELHPAWSLPRHRLGLLAHEDGDHEGAIPLFRGALDRDPDDSRLADLLDLLAPEGLGLAGSYVPDEIAIERAIASARELRPRSGAQVVYLVDHEVTEVQSDGGAKRIVTQVALAVNTDGRDQLIQNNVPSGKVKILHAYAVQPDGERQEASSIRSGTVRFRGLMAGSITVMQYVHYARPRGFLPTHFFAEWYFQGVQAQYQHSQWVVLLPEGKELAVHGTGDFEARRERKDGRQVRIFEANGVPPFAPEPYMPSARDLLRKVSVTTLTSWDEYVRWERALLSQVFREDPEVKALAKKLTKGAKTPREKFDALFHYVAQEIRYQQDYESTIAGVRPHACPIVLARGYGDCKDKAVLLILLAREVGVDVDFAILRTRDAGEVVREIPNQQFNHAIVYVPEQDGIETGFFLDPTVDALDKGNLRGDDQGAWSLVLDPDSGEYQFIKIPFAAPDRESQKYVVDLDIEKGGARAEVSLTVRGGFGSSLRRLMRNPERAAKFHQGVAGRLLIGARLASVEISDIDDIENPLTIKHTLDASRAVVPAGAERKVQLPGTFMFPLRQAGLLDERTHPLSFGPPDSLSFDMNIKLPEGARIARVPDALKVEHACFQLSRDVTTEGRDVKVAVRFTRTCTRVEAEAYPGFRDAVQDAARDIDGEVRFIPAVKGKLAFTR
jgi:tetratricopeptide (TPR) repeat protein